MAKVSIILPTYNRARFLPQAVDSIRAQTFADWELIVIDDGSTDDTPQVMERLVPTVPQSIRYIRQANAGPPGARNAGLDNVGAPYVAFLDSDDLWLPHHLADCVAALDAHADFDLVLGALRRVEPDTGRVVEESTFHPDGEPHALLRLRHRKEGKLHLIDDPRLFATVLYHGGVGVLQNTLYRARVFETIRMRPYRVCDDRFFGFELVASGYRPACLDDVHVIYNLHAAGHISAPGGVGAVDKQVDIAHQVIGCYEDAGRVFALNRCERRALDRRLAHEWFWHLGYNLLWAHGRSDEALDAFRRGLAYDPWNAGRWKTYLLARLRSAARAWA